MPRGDNDAERRVDTLFNPPATFVTPEMAPWRRDLNRIIFGADTPVGRAFDLALLWLILLSVLAVMLESVAAIEARLGGLLRTVEWVLTALFTLEYILRLACVRRPLGYARSFFGLVDLISIVPTYLSIFLAGTQALVVIRILRVTRFFKLFALSQLSGQAAMLTAALLRSRQKITVFLVAVGTLVIIMGTIMYLVEGADGGFTSIPRSIYWAIVTLTTVGYGDIAPRTGPGQAISAAVMILGYAIIAVPTGIVSVELAEQSRREARARMCPACDATGHDEDARYCRRCGEPLEDDLM